MSTFINCTWCGNESKKTRKDKKFCCYECRDNHIRAIKNSKKILFDIDSLNNRSEFIPFEFNRPNKELIISSINILDSRASSNVNQRLKAYGANIALKDWYNGFRTIKYSLLDSDEYVRVINVVKQRLYDTKNTIFKHTYYYLVQYLEPMYNLSEPMIDRPRPSKSKKVEWGKTVSEWSSITGINPKTIYKQSGCGVLVKRGSYITNASMLAYCQKRNIEIKDIR